VWIRDDFAKAGVNLPAFDLALAITWEETRGEQSRSTRRRSPMDAAGFSQIERRPATMSDADYIVVGSGINALVVAAMLGRKGRKVLVLERNDRIGGCLRTEEITVPGFVHDVMATTVVLFLLSPAYAALGKDLHARGLEIAGTDTPTAALLPDGRAAVFSTDRASNLAMFDELAMEEGARFARVMDDVGANAPLVFSLLGSSFWSGGMLKTVLKEAWRRGPRALAAFFGEALETARAHLETTYQSEVTQALWAPWVLHAGLGPESAYSAQMAKVIAFALRRRAVRSSRAGRAISPPPSASSLRIKAAA
jgi:phytoene dehydrogenase-like protein